MSVLHQTPSLKQLGKDFGTTFKSPKALRDFAKVSLENHNADLNEELEKVNKAIIEFYLVLVKDQTTNKVDMEREQERMEKLPPSIIFDYLKGFVYKMQNDYDEMKAKLQKLGVSTTTSKTAPVEDEDDKFGFKQIESLKTDNWRLKEEIEKTVKEYKELQAQKKFVADSAKISINKVNFDFEKLKDMFREKEIEIDKERTKAADAEVECHELRAKLAEQGKLDQKV